MKTVVLGLTVALILTGCSSAQSRADRERRAAAMEAAGGEAEPHDRSAFAKDPAQMHIDSPDEADMHPPAARP